MGFCPDASFRLTGELGSGRSGTGESSYFSGSEKGANCIKEGNSVDGEQVLQ